MNNWILKILSGPHADAEINLMQGRYTVGSGDTDDLVLSASVLEPDHFYLDVSERGVKLTLSKQTLPLSINGHCYNHDEVEIEEQTIISLGHLYFAIGTNEDNWQEIQLPQQDVKHSENNSKPVEVKTSNTTPKKIPRKTKLASIVSSAAGVVIVFLVLFFQSEEPLATAPVVKLTPEEQWLEMGEQLDIRQLELMITGKGHKIKGYIDTQESLEQLHSLLDIVGLDARVDVVVVQDIIDKTHSILRENSIEDLRVTQGSLVDVFVIEGSINNEMQWNNALEVIHRNVQGVRQWQTQIQRINNDEDETPQITLGFSVRSISVGATPFIVADSGQKYAEGSQLSSGHVIEEITTEFVNVKRGDKSFRVAIGD